MVKDCQKKLCSRAPGPARVGLATCSRSLLGPLRRHSAASRKTSLLNLRDATAWDRHWQPSRHPAVCGGLEALHAYSDVTVRMQSLAS
jgi:hypothetical protein